ncbi:MAG: S8 family serine peptidase [Burkholderiales bacterium]|nr:S8 family serine peptidase [Burkholderiales bacterium]
MKRAGHLMLTLRSGEAPRHVPAHLDCLAGAGRPASRLDGGRIDAALSRYGGGARIESIYHARRSLGRFGEHHANFDDQEEALGLSRSYRIQLGDGEGDESVVAALRDLAAVEAVSVQLLIRTEDVMHDNSVLPDMKLARQPHEQINAIAALAMEAGDERVTTAVVDTGIVIGHPEFQRKCLAGYDTVDIGMGRVGDKLKLVGDSRGLDYNPYDEVGHGCHVAGIIGAQGWHLPRGVGGRSLLLAVRVLAGALDERRGKRVGVGCQPDIDSGMKVAADLGADVINMSFGTPASSLDPAAPVPHRSVVAYASSMGCTLVAAAGNSGIEEIIYPAALSEVICCASVDAKGRRSSFSTQGDHVTLAAPGEQILSCAQRGYQVSSGTSFAAPFVSGVASLMKARAMRAGSRLDGAQTKALLIDSCKPLGTGGFSRDTGHGQLDALAALQALDRWLQGKKGRRS